MSNLRDQYKREFNNWILAVAQTVHGIQFDNKATLEEKLKALDVMHKQIAAAKRTLIFISNTQPPRDL